MLLESKLAICEVCPEFVLLSHKSYFTNSGQTNELFNYYFTWLGSECSVSSIGRLNVYVCPKFVVDVLDMLLSISKTDR
jgi:hypothetical protein